MPEPAAHIINGEGPVVLRFAFLFFLKPSGPGSTSTTGPADLTLLLPLGLVPPPANPKSPLPVLAFFVFLDFGSAGGRRGGSDGESDRSALTRGAAGGSGDLSSGFSSAFGHICIYIRAPGCTSCSHTLGKIISPSVDIRSKWPAATCSPRTSTC